MKAENAKVLNSIFRLVFDIPTPDLVENIRRINHPRWDSLAQVSLIAAIESEFNLSLDIREREEISSYASADLLLTERGL